ncbi:hypothetical protein [Pseudodesulfovibrio indicus]|uniref:Uncharacterized protein n=1 Tax=Pseudodesulfovibrio indicus TaxID=1716143 RepID=A0A140D8V9_9BACT|nr:hypothetical protein [Pseudodesulfovibrio indicus]AMK09626.1 hypothetical protein AWY79_00135 [Pseudodesulfovibrio indicus]TDT86426.1 hypothetical protein EDC59_113102 [Pseudodesulfovibrio indicus]
MATRKLVNAKDILGSLDLQELISNTAATEDELGALQERAVTAVSMAMSLEIENEKQLTDEALATIAGSVVTTMDVKSAALSGYQVLVSYFGPTGVPDQLPTTWAKSWSGWRIDTPLIPEIAPERSAALTDVQHTASAAIQAVMDVEGVLRDLGRLDATLFYANVADSMLVQIFEKVKKEKAYKKLHYHDESGNLRQFQTLEEFCGAKLGKSYRRLQELSGHMQALGADLYEAAERIGFRNRDYRALKALPEAEQAIVKQAIESESKEEVLTILEDLAARNQAEREAARKEREDLAADHEARGKLLEDKSQRLAKTEEELYRLKSLPKDADLELRLAREAEAVQAMEKAYMAALVGLNELLVQVEAILNSHDVSVHTSQHAVGTVGNYCRAVNAVLIKHEIPVDFEEEVSPEWMRETALDELEAGRTNIPTGRGW